MSSDGVAIRVRDVSKHYLLFNQPQDRLKQSIIPRLQRLAGRKPTQYYRDFAALNHVSFEVRRGETVGVIGRNGSGKSTLLQIVCGTLRANSGTVEVHGRIAALLELGAGFNPEFTGRENVYLNAAILGLSRGEVAARFDEIARFADIGDFIDQPVKTYSSGMYVRLAFATAINVDPDILVVDEALAVGDEAFQRKCFARIEQIQERGGTILFVTHGVQTVVQLCTRALLFDHGELLLDGPPKLVTSHYQRLLNVAVAQAQAVREDVRRLMTNGAVENGSAQRAHADGSRISVEAPPQPEQPAFPLECYDRNLVSNSVVEYERHGAVISGFALLTTANERVNILRMGKTYVFQYDVDFTAAQGAVGFGMMIKTTTGFELAGATTSLSRNWRLDRVESGESRRVRFRFVCTLMPGSYFLNAGVSAAWGDGRRHIHRVLDALPFRVAPEADLTATGIVDLLIAPEISSTPT